jgi:predicted DNA-binding protein
MEDDWLADKATETLENIKLGKEKLISWEEAKKRLSA